MTALSPPPASSDMLERAGTDVDRSGIDELARTALEAALKLAVRGEVRFDSQTRAVYSADSSNYRQIPLGVVFPLDHDDVAAVIKVCREHNAPLLGRGAGTSLAGQACNVAVVLDFSRHLNKVLEIDVEKRTARVQPGVVLDDLQAELAKVGLTFGPDPATHAWCTVGGMIGNNSCGAHALYTGKTVDCIASLRILTYDGLEAEVGAYDEAAYGAVVAQGGPLAAAFGGLRELGRRYADLVRERYPDIPRRVSGYNLDQLLPGASFNVARALVGTESTCVIVTEATILLSRRPAERRVLLLGYPDIFAAADAVPSLLELGSRLGDERGVEHALLGLEGFDSTLVRQTRKANLNPGGLALLPPGEGWLIVEIGADDSTVTDELAAAFAAALPAEVHWRRFDDNHRQRLIWSVRESGLGATAHPPGEAPNHEGWEDAAVDPAKLGDYLRAISALWKEFGYAGAWYGHFGQGCAHTRNNFEFDTPEHLAKFRAFMERAADICISFGGSLSGEHGDGQARAELLTKMYGPELVDAFRMFKAIWDPRGRMNPGKVVDPYPLDTNLKHGPTYRPTKLDTLFYDFPHDHGSLQMATERCVGVGRCRRDDTGVMCPSYRVTRDEAHSTRGRAKLLTEMMRGDVTPEAWHNKDVHDALELCLSCKGCAVDCPTHVDMATYKSEFMAHYYRGRLRPRVDYALAALPWLARIASRVPWLANVLIGENPVGRAGRRFAGVTTNRPAPRFAPLPFRRSKTAKARTSTGANATVVVWPDTFSNAFRPQLLEDTVAALEAAGETVVVPTAWACCGRTLYDSGLLERAKTTLKQLLDVLSPYVEQGLFVVVPEPSCLAAFRDELPLLLPDDARAAKLAAASRSLSEQLLHSPKLAGAVSGGERALVHPHCHSRAIGTSDSDRAILEKLGFDVEVLDAGCCGLAGGFGFNEKHEPMSRQIAQDWWLPKLRSKAAGAALVVDGFSCDMQLAETGGAEHGRARTLASVILAVLDKRSD